MAQIAQDINGNVTLLPDTTGNVNLVMQNNTVLSVSSGNVIAPAAGARVTFNGAVAMSNIVGNTTTFGYFINSTTGRNQLNNVGFTFNQDGDVLTPTNKTRYAYGYTGSDQTFVVPAGVNWIFVKLWGAGGGAGRVGGWSYGSDGGGGGHTRGLIPVTPGATIYVKVGSGGFTSPGTGTQYGGGGTGGGNGDSQYSGMGGGFCGVFTGSVSFANALAIAGGGGAGGSLNGPWAYMAQGGAGGGAQAQRGLSALQATFANGGGGASTNAGGVAGTGNNTGANAGTQLTGGNAGTNNYGGGGGGGYYGGGGGAYTNSTIMGGGGGGSGYVISTARYAATYTGQYRSPAMFWDNDLTLGSSTIGSSYIELYAFGGQNTQNNLGTNSLSGGHAYAVIYY